MFFSLTSFMTALTGGCIMIGVLTIYSKNTSEFYSVSYKFLLLTIGWIVLRLMLPFETVFTITVRVEKMLPLITDFWRKERYITDDYYFCIYQVAIAVWIAGVCYTLLRVGAQYLRLLRAVRTLSEDARNDMLSTVKECVEPKYLERVNVVITDCVDSPCILGVRKATVLLPDIGLSKEEQEFILLHELQHFKNKDLLFKFLLEIILAIYWWNPIIFLLKKQVTNLLEIRVDSNISREWNKEKRIRYLELLVKLGRYRSNMELSEYALALSGQSSMLLTRANQIMNRENKIQMKFTIICISVIIIFSCFIFEPHDLKAAMEDWKNEDTFGAEVFENEGYIVESDGEYTLYIQDEVMGILENPFSEEFVKFPIYSDVKEGLQNEEN